VDRTCKGCGTDKAMDLFPKRPDFHTGYGHWCWECVYSYRDRLSQYDHIQINHKRCTKCGEVKATDDTAKRKPVCKRCLNALGRARKALRSGKISRLEHELRTQGQEHYNCKIGTLDKHNSLDHNKKSLKSHKTIADIRVEQLNAPCRIISKPKG